MDFAYSDKVRDLQRRVTAFMDEHVYPNEARFHDEIEQNRRNGNAWVPTKVVEELKKKARAAGLWNLWLPESEYGAGLTNLEYAPLCEIMGRSHIGPEAFNCSAPDTGNMEVLVRYGNEEQKRQWLKPLLEGEIRSGFAMTEPAVASSDATNIEASIVRDGDHYVVNGRKWWTSGAGDPRCKILIFMGKTDPQQREPPSPAVDDPGADGHARACASCARCRCSATTMRRTGTPRWISRTCACRCRTCCSARGAASRSRRDGSARAASTTACG